ncbi:MAG: hypothetical protein Q3979_06900 [Actinomycetaceae bacterium]|nr:hypothetical protein [Actinomycetaceae bacterium]
MSESSFDAPGSPPDDAPDSAPGQPVAERRERQGIESHEATAQGTGQAERPGTGLSEEDIAQLRAIQKRRLVVFGILGVVLLILGFFAGRTMRNQQADAAAVSHAVGPSRYLVAEGELVPAASPPVPVLGQTVSS